MSRKYKRNENWRTDIDEFQEEAVQSFEDFLDGLPKIDISKEEAGDEYEMEREMIGWQYVYTDGASNLARRMLDRLYKLGEKLFPGQTIDISTHHFQEP